MTQFILQLTFILILYNFITFHFLFQLFILYTWFSWLFVIIEWNLCNNIYYSSLTYFVQIDGNFPWWAQSTILDSLWAYLWEATWQIGKFPLNGMETSI